MNLLDLIALVLETIVIGIFTLQCVQHHSLLRSALVLLVVLFLTYSSSLAALAAPYFQTITSQNYPTKHFTESRINLSTPLELNPTVVGQH
ncbi:hypothetical protein ACL6C3_29980 [Capilliphycus salinus ALCB114379]|uniref:hypothetical protein n=1 Tax=Capilliphycus salinus TaxID=2768948 RepID=UPI0039A48350